MQGRSLSVALVIATTLLGPSPDSSSAAEPAPRSKDRYIARAVTTLMTTSHYSKPRPNDEIAQRARNLFLRELDPTKIYFRQSDIDEILEFSGELDDMLRKGDVSFATRVFASYLDRVDDCMKIVEELLQEEHDFTIDEELTTDNDALRYAANDAESHERWRKRIKYDLLLLKTDGVSIQEARQRLQRRYQEHAKKLHALSGDEMLEVFLSAFTAAFDPHSKYMSPASLDEYRIQMRPELEGIGAALRLSERDIVVSRIIPDGAADRHGKLKAEDRIVTIGQGDEGEMKEVRGQRLNNVVNLIRGPIGTVVRLGVIPAGKEETVIYTITRGNIELQDRQVSGHVVQKGVRKDGSPRKIGWLTVPSVYLDQDSAKLGLANFSSASRDVRRQLLLLREQAVDVVILDLRSATGNSLSEAIKLTGLFIDHGPIVQTKNADGSVQQYEDLERGSAWNGPLVVLSNRFCEGPSECIVAAIQDYQRGLVIGDATTRGKGTVQSLIDLKERIFPDRKAAPNLGALLVTTQQTYRLNGASIQQRGVAPDVVLPSLANEMDLSEVQLDYAIQFESVPASSYTKLAMIDNVMLAKLKKQSSSRVDDSPGFQNVMKSMLLYREGRAKKSVTLNEQKIIKEREQDQAAEADSSGEEVDINVQGPNYYLREVVQISLDYVDLLDK